MRIDVQSTKYALNITIVALSILLPLTFTQIIRARLEYRGSKKVWKSTSSNFPFQAAILFTSALLAGIWNINRFPTTVVGNEFINQGEARLTLFWGALQFSCFALGLVRMIRSLEIFTKNS